MRAGKASAILEGNDRLRKGISDAEAGGEGD